MTSADCTYDLGDLYLYDLGELYISSRLGGFGQLFNHTQQIEESRRQHNIKDCRTQTASLEFMHSDLISRLHRRRRLLLLLLLLAGCVAARRRLKMHVDRRMDGLICMP